MNGVLALLTFKCMLAGTCWSTVLDDKTWIIYHKKMPSVTMPGVSGAEMNTVTITRGDSKLILYAGELKSG